jgi:DNA-binding MurR/RpiR family transcriptional regulator
MKHARSILPEENSGMDNPINLINKRYNSLRDSEKRVAEFVQKRLEDVVLISLHGLALSSRTSDATVMRFCRSLGYRCFPDFKAALIPELLRRGHDTYLQDSKTRASKSAIDVFQRNIHQQVDLTLRNCQEEKLRFIARRISESGRILIVGLGGSGGVALIFCDSLGSLGIFSSYLYDRSLIQNMVPTMAVSDVIVGISHSGETEEVVTAVRMAREYGILTVSITNFSPSPLTAVSEHVLLTSVPDNLLGSFSCQARMSQLAVLELVLYEISKLMAENSSGENPK